MENSSPFLLFGPAHLTVLFLIPLWTVFSILLARRFGERATRRFEGANVCITALGLGIQQTFRVSRGYWDPRWDLPMQLCDWAFIALAAAFITRRKIFYDLSYYWGLAGTLQGTLTPALDVGFPHIKFIYFFLFHAGIVSGTIFNAVAGKRNPGPGSVLRVFLISQIYAAATMPVNFLLHANYGFLMEKPSGASLMDFFGPWPWYILALEIAGFIFFLLLYLPWFLKRKILGFTGRRDPTPPD